MTLFLKECHLPQARITLLSLRGFPDVLCFDSENLLILKNSLSWTLGICAEKWNISWHISKQGCHHHQWLQPASVSRWALRKLRKEKNISNHQTTATPQGKPWGKEAQDVKTKDTGPRELRCIPNNFSESTLAYFCTKGSAQFLDLRYLVFLINNIIFSCSDYLPFVTKFLYNLAHPLTSSKLSGLLEMLSPGLDVLKISTE